MRSRHTTVVLLLAAVLVGCAPVAPTPAPVVVSVQAPVAVEKAAVPPPAVREVPAEPAEEVAEPEAEAVAPVSTGALSIPSLGFSATHVETISPDADGVVRPTTRDGLARVTADGLLAELWAVHSGGPSGSGPGGVLTAAGDPARFVGAQAMLPDGSAAVVVDAWVSDKSTTTSRLAEAFADPGAVVLVTCQVESTPRAQHNVVILLRRV